MIEAVSTIETLELMFTEYKILLSKDRNNLPSKINLPYVIFYVHRNITALTSHYILHAK